MSIIQRYLFKIQCVKVLQIACLCLEGMEALLGVLNFTYTSLMYHNTLQGSRASRKKEGPRGSGSFITGFRSHSCSTVCFPYSKHEPATNL